MKVMKVYIAYFYFWYRRWVAVIDFACFNWKIPVSIESIWCLNIHMEIFPFNEKLCGEKSACNFCDAKKFTKARTKYSFGNSLLKYAKVVCLNLLICFIVKHY